MITWFVKFTALIILITVAWITPVSKIMAHVSYIDTMEQRVSVLKKSSEKVSNLEELELFKEIVEYELLQQDVREVSAYNAGDPNQTDDSPCISANNENICNALDAGYNRCAANFVKFGTRLRIETVSGDWSMECIVTDRMNSRYPNRVDIAMKKDEKTRALKFGVQRLVVSILTEK